jgi:hemolysin III
VTLTTLACSGWWGGGLFAFIWGAALLGTYTSFQGLKEHSNLETVVYCIMGLSVLAVFHVFVKCVSMAAVWWLLAEGAAYLTGAVMYAYSHNRPYVHTLFHIFVIAGTACHVMATLEVYKDYV